MTQFAVFYTRNMTNYKTMITSSRPSTFVRRTCFVTASIMEHLSVITRQTYMFFLSIINGTSRETRSAACLLARSSSRLWFIVVPWIKCLPLEVCSEGGDDNDTFVQNSLYNSNLRDGYWNQRFIITLTDQSQVSDVGRCLPFFFYMWGWRPRWTRMWNLSLFVENDQPLRRNLHQLVYSFQLNWLR